jgi:CheY-like chemotaxis protein
VEGPELCRRVRDHDAPYAYFILLTALGDQQHHLTGGQSGADDYLAKPFDMEDFGARMVTAERVITLHRRREALLRLARPVATSTDPATLFATLMDEALLLSRVEAGSSPFRARTTRLASSPSNWSLTERGAQNSQDYARGRAVPPASSSRATMDAAVWRWF